MLYLNKLAMIKDFIFNKNAAQLLSTEVNSNITELEKFKSKFSDEQLILVLTKLKKFSLIEMQKYGISENKYRRLEHIKYKYKDKPTNIVDEIISCNVMNVADLTNLCENITVGKKISHKSLIKTSIGTGHFKDIKTAIGIRTGNSCVTWTQLDLTSCNCNVLKLDSYYNIISGATCEAPDIIRRAMDLANSLPVVDAYVMEKQPTKVPTTKLNYSTLQTLMQREHLFSGLIAGLLSNIESRKSTHSCKLYFLRPNSSANYYKLMLGKEVVSADNIIQAILTKKYAGNLLSVSISDELLNYYHSVHLFKKEDFNVTLLMTIMFLENVLFTKTK